MPSEVVIQLEAKRQQLALDAQEGDREAEKALRQVEQQIAQQRLQEERQALAERERAERATAEEQARARSRRLELEAQVAALGRERAARAAAVDQVTDALVAALEALLETTNLLYTTSVALNGSAPQSLNGHGMVEDYLSWRLRPYVRALVPPPERTRRRPLAELLAVGPR